MSVKGFTVKSCTILLQTSNVWYTRTKEVPLPNIVTHIALGVWHCPNSELGMFCLADFEEQAREKVDKKAWDFYFSGADHQQTLEDNVKAFSRYRFRPRVLRDVSKVTLRTQLLGEWAESPVGVAPTGLQKMAHEEGEMATAQACAQTGHCMILSSWSNTSMEDVAEAAGKVGGQGGSMGLRWFQLQVFSSRTLTSQLIRRAEKFGYKALVVTVDTPILGRRLAALKSGFDLPDHLRMPNISLSGKASSNSQIESQTPGLHQYTRELINPGMDWDELDWLCGQTSLPVILKGILTKEDAREALRHRGVQGIVVSNHGARQLDGVPATIDALSEVVSEVRGRVEVYLDGGVRQGTDVLKALALGARAVFVGRPVLWGLACGGRHGVKQVLGMLRDELKLAMQLAGCSDVSDVNSDLVVQEQYYKISSKM